MCSPYESVFSAPKLFSDLTGSISKTVGKDNAVGALYIGMIGLLVSDLIPTPADAVYFLYEKQLRDKWTAGKFTPKQYWLRQAGAYYPFNAFWWSAVLLGTVAIGGGIKRKLTFASGVLGAGAVVAVLVRNIAKDTKEGNGAASGDVGDTHGIPTAG